MAPAAPHFILAGHAPITTVEDPNSKSRLDHIGTALPLAHSETDLGAKVDEAEAGITVQERRRVRHKPHKPHRHVGTPLMYTHTHTITIYVDPSSTLISVKRPAPEHDDNPHEVERSSPRPPAMKETNGATMKKHASIEETVSRSGPPSNQQYSNASSFGTQQQHTAANALDSKPTSSYPRPSPPGFLYPDAIVPTHRHHTVTQHADRHPVLRSSRSVMDSDTFWPGFRLPDVPPAIQIVVYGAIGLGVLWIVLVALVNFPPSTWGCRAKGVGKKGKGKKPWWTGIRGGWSEKGKKHDDEDLVYRPIASGSTSTGSAEANVPWAGGSAMEMRTMASAIVPHSTRVYSASASPATSTNTSTSIPTLRKRTIPSAQHQAANQELIPRDQPIPPESPSIPPWQSNDSQASSASPENPFLPPPQTVRPRSSEEYLVAHATFFNGSCYDSGIRCSLASSRPPSRAPSSTSLVSATSHFSFDDVNHLEAQMDMPDRQWVSSDTDSGGDNGLVKRRWGRGSFLEAVDGAMDKAVGKFVRWTEDDGVDDGLVLPFSGKGIVN